MVNFPFCADSSYIVSYILQVPICTNATLVTRALEIYDNAYKSGLMQADCSDPCTYFDLGYELKRKPKIGGVPKKTGALIIQINPTVKVRNDLKLIHTADHSHGR